MVNRLPHVPMFRGADNLALHQATGRAFGPGHGLLDSCAVGGFQNVQDRFLLTLAQIFDQIDNIVGFELGRCYGAGMVAADVTDALRWPSQDCFEDHSLYEAVVSHAELRSRVAEADELLYVHRRHASNVTAPHRKDMWQGVLPLQLAGPSATAAPERVRAMLQRHAGVAFLVDSEAAETASPR